MGEQCCCGRIKPCDEPLIINQTKHEPLGPPGAFCGPVLHHDLRDYKAETERLKALNAELIEACKDLTAICAGAAPEHDLAIKRARELVSKAESEAS